MEVYSILEEAKAVGACLGRYGQYPTIYRRSDSDYILVEQKEWPPLGSWPFLKWDGKDWLPVLVRPDTLEHAQKAVSLFALLGHRPIIVEFPGITFDLFFKETHVPSGAWIVSRMNPDFIVKRMKPPDDCYEDDQSDIIEIEIPIS